MKNEIAIYLNKVVQGIIPLNDSLQWFNNLDDEQRILMLETLIYYVQQSGMSASSIKNFLEPARLFSGLKIGHTPVQILKSIEQTGLMSTSALKVGLYKFLKLPKTEQNQSFLLLVGILNYNFHMKKNSDPRKWWYEDLSQDKNLPGI